MTRRILRSCLLGMLLVAVVAGAALVGARTPAQAVPDPADEVAAPLAFSTPTQEEIDDLLERLDDGRLVLTYQFMDVDAPTRFAQVRLLPRPVEPIGGLRNTTWFLSGIDLRLTVDSAIPVGEGFRNTVVLPGDPDTPIAYGAIDLEMDVDVFEVEAASSRDLFWYPFDTYRYHLGVTLEQRPSIPGAHDAADGADGAGGEDGADGVEVTGSGDWEPLPGVLLPYQWGLGDFDVVGRPATMQGAISPVEDVAAQLNDGQVSQQVLVRRTTATRLLVVVFALAILTILVSVVYIAVMVARRQRPPTTPVLVWIAALVFALVALRGALPGDPPIGIAFDYLLFLPALIVACAETIFLVVQWTRRSDYVA